MFAAKEETPERLHSVHVVVWHTEIEADGRQPRNWFVMTKHDMLLCCVLILILAASRLL